MIQATLSRRATPRSNLDQLDLNQLARDALKPWADAYGAWNSAYGAWTDGVSGLMRPMTGKAACGCQACRTGCCQPDPCACRCCVSDCDLLVEARVGERRIIPITIQNQWRRARDIDLDLSSWTKLTDTLAVQGEIITPDKFTLAPCGEAQVVLLLTIAPIDAQVEPKQPPAKLDTEAQARAAKEAEAAKAAEAARTAVPPEAARRILGDRSIEGNRFDRVLPDVDRCAVSYADLRIAGCDLRSIRIAVAVSPRDCDSYVVDCCCSCC